MSKIWTTHLIYPPSFLSSQFLAISLPFSPSATQHPCLLASLPPYLNVPLPPCPMPRCLSVFLTILPFCLLALMLSTLLFSFLSPSTLHSSYSFRFSLVRVVV